MAHFYASASDFIKKRNFEVWVPAFYHRDLPEGVLETSSKPREKINRFRMVPTRQRSPVPLRPMIDPSQMQRASYPIEAMLDMFQKKIEFELATESDVVAILDGLDWYLGSLKQDVERGEDLYVNYARLVIRWRDEVYKHYYRYMTNNPSVLETLYPNGSLTNNLIHLMSSLGTKADHLELNPLLAKAKPPYQVDMITPKDPIAEQTELEKMESSFGLSSMDKFDADGNFDVEDFLSRG